MRDFVQSFGYSNCVLGETWQIRMVWASGTYEFE